LQSSPAAATLSPVPQPTKAEDAKMKNPLDSITGTIVSGVVLTVVLYFIVGAL